MQRFVCVVYHHKDMLRQLGSSVRHSAPRHSAAPARTNEYLLVMIQVLYMD